MCGEIHAFFLERPQEETLWNVFSKRCAEKLGPYKVKVNKTQLSLFSGCMFACVSHPRSKKLQGIVVTFGLPFKAESPRIWQAAQPYSGRWTHHVLVSAPEQIDEELLNWLSAAQAFAQKKKR